MLRYRHNQYGKNGAEWDTRTVKNPTARTITDTAITENCDQPTNVITYSINTQCPTMAPFLGSLYTSGAALCTADAGLAASGWRTFRPGAHWIRTLPNRGTLDNAYHRLHHLGSNPWGAEINSRLANYPQGRATPELLVQSILCYILLTYDHRWDRWVVAQKLYARLLLPSEPPTLENHIYRVEWLL